MSSNSLFNVLPEFQKVYIDTVDTGKNFIENKNIIVTGLTRNNSQKLYKNINLINELKANIKYFLYENDSTDNTPTILKDLSKDLPNFEFISEKLGYKQFGQVKDKERTERLSRHRNICLDHIKNFHINSDYIIVIDFDFEAISLEGIYHSFGLFNKYNQISGIAGFSYQLKNENILWNYDSWAFRWTWWEDLQSYISPNNIIDPMYWFGLYRPPIGSAPIAVNSAFGGCAIYKTQTFIKGHYSGHDCEHVTFHKSLYDNVNNFYFVANPSQIMLFI